MFRLDSAGDGNNNQKSLKLFGHPNVLKLPSIMPATELAAIIQRLVHTDVNYSIVTVDGVVSTLTLPLKNAHVVNVTLFYSDFFGESCI